MTTTSNHRARQWLVALTTVAATGFAASPANAADPDPLGGENTILAIDPGVVGALDDADIKVKPVDPASGHSEGVVAFPITGGKLDPANVEGKIKHKGGLRFKSGNRKVVLKDFVVELGEKNFLTAEVGKGTLKVFKLDTSGATIDRDGFNTEISGVQAVLTKPAAKALNKILKTDLFAKDLVVGGVTVLAVPESAALLAQGNTTLALDSGAAAALESEGITSGVIPPATAHGGGLAFPITGGRVDAETLAGKITHSGGISLTEHPMVVELTDFAIRIDEAPDLTARLSNDRVSILDLDLSTATIDIDGRSITVSCVEARLTADAAAALNAAFATSAFTEGLLLGTATVAAEAR